MSRATEIFSCNAGASCAPDKIATACASDDAARMRMPSTADASAAFSVGNNTASKPSSLAKIAMQIAPRIGRMRPSSANSPAANKRPNPLACAEVFAMPLTPPSANPRAPFLRFNAPDAINTDNAIGTSNAGPSLRKSAGAKFIATRPPGHAKPVLATAVCTRSTASRTDASGKPVSVVRGKPWPLTSTSISHGTASMPRSAKPNTLVCAARTPPCTISTRRSPSLATAVSASPPRRLSAPCSPSFAAISSVLPWPMLRRIMTRKTARQKITAFFPKILQINDWQAPACNTPYSVKTRPPSKNFNKNKGITDCDIPFISGHYATLPRSKSQQLKETAPMVRLEMSAMHEQ